FHLRSRASAALGGRNAGAPLPWLGREEVGDLTGGLTQLGRCQPGLTPPETTQVASSSNGAPSASGSASSASAVSACATSAALSLPAAAAAPPAAAAAPAAAPELPELPELPDPLVLPEPPEEDEELRVRAGASSSSISASRTIRRGSYWRGSSLVKSKSSA